MRVSRTRADVPSSASAHCAVAVATPDRWHSRLSAVRSAVSRSRVRPVTVSRTSPRETRAPSPVTTAISASPSDTMSNTAAATGTPAVTPVPRATRSIVERWSAGTVAAEVTSTPPSRSSATVARTSAST